MLNNATFRSYRGTDGGEDRANGRDLKSATIGIPPGPQSACCADCIGERLLSEGRRTREDGFKGPRSRPLVLRNMAAAALLTAMAMLEYIDRGVLKLRGPLELRHSEVQ